MGLDNLAEGIILQSMEDLWSRRQRESCIAFFKGEGFAVCAKMAGMSLPDQQMLLGIVDDIIKRGNSGVKAKKVWWKQKERCQDKTAASGSRRFFVPRSFVRHGAFAG